MGNNGSPVGNIMITGISASGKTTLGSQLFQRINGNVFNKVKLLDGDAIREEITRKYNITYGYSTKDRNELSMKIADIALEYNNKGFVCVICCISHKKEIRKKMRERLDNFMEIYLDCPVEICAARDYKGQYQKALAGEYDNFIGVTEPYETSDNANLILQTNKLTIEECTDLLLENVLKYFNK